jgi:polysaccharide export outer membrane protein
MNLAFLCTIPFYLASTMAQAEYRLGPGDVLEFSVIGIPELRQRVTLGPDGNITLPLGGQVRAAGLTASELQSSVQDVTAGRVYRPRSNDGREIIIGLARDQILVSIAEYRPIYVNGDVARPGEHAFKPGMTVRKAIALAGGYELAAFKAGNFDPIELRSERDRLLAELAELQIRFVRLNSELNKSPELAVPGNVQYSIAPELLEQIIKRQSEQLKLNLADYEKQKVYLKTVMEQAQLEVASLLEQKDQEEKNIQTQKAEIGRVKDMTQRGMTPITRLSQEERVLILSVQHLSQLTGGVATARRSVEDFKRQLERLDDQRSLDLSRTIQEAQVSIPKILARIQATEDKLMFGGTGRSQWALENGRKLSIEIFRQQGDSVERTSVSQDSEVAPGDVVEIRFDLHGRSNSTDNPTNRMGPAVTENPRSPVR